MKLFKQTLAVFALAAATIAGPVSTVQAVPLPLGGPWVVIDEQGMTAPQFFTGSWEFTCPPPHCKFYITDLFVVSDQFEVYDFGGLIATTPAMPDWDDLLIADPFTSPPWTNDPDVAWATPEFSKMIIILAAGAHSITIRDIHIPSVSAGGPAFPDGTVAFRVLVPEPGTLALLGIALAGLGFSRRKMS